MNQILTSLTTNQCEHTTNTYGCLYTTRISTSSIISTIVIPMIVVMGMACLTGCSKSSDDVDYIALFNLNDLSPEFKQYELLPEDEEYRDKDLKAMIWDSKDTITTGIYQDATTLRMKGRSEGAAAEIPEWFLKRGFTCGALTALAGKDLAPPAIPHIYRKGHTLIHIMRYWAPKLKQDPPLESNVWRITIIQYKNVTQTFYPCQGNKISVYGITDPMPIIKHQDGHVTIDHAIANKAWKARQEAEEGK